MDAPAVRCKRRLDGQHELLRHAFYKDIKSILLAAELLCVWKILQVALTYSEILAGECVCSLTIPPRSFIGW